MARTVRTRVHNGAIQSMFVSGGGIHEYGRRVSFTTTARMKEFAVRHSRTGELARSLHTRSEVGRNRVRWVMYSTAQHALFLERGTRPQFGSRTLYRDVYLGKRSWMAANPHWHDTVGWQVHSVAGIRPYRFMTRALNSALRRYRLV